MSDTVIINDDVLEALPKTLKGYLKETSDLFKNTLKAILANEDEWRDRDFDDLVSAIKSFSSDIVSVENAVSSLTSRVDDKISAIRQLHNLQI